MNDDRITPTEFFDGWLTALAMRGVQRVSFQSRDLVVTNRRLLAVAALLDGTVEAHEANGQQDWRLADLYQIAGAFRPDRRDGDRADHKFRVFFYAEAMNSNMLLNYSLGIPEYDLQPARKPSNIERLADFSAANRALVDDAAEAYLQPDAPHHPTPATVTFLPLTLLAA